MKKIEIIGPEGEVLAIAPRYESLYDVPLKSAVNFLVAAKPLYERSDEEKEINYYMTMVNSVCALYGIDVKAILNAIAVSIDEDIRAFQVLFAYASSLFSNYKPQIRSLDECVFELGDSIYRIPTHGFRTLTALPEVPSDLSVREAIEAYEIARIAQSRIANSEGVDDGSALYTYYINLCAVLLRKEGEDLPISEVEMENFVMQRSMYFDALPISAGIAFDIDFFFANMMKPYEQTRAAVGFLSNLLLNLAVATAALGNLKSRRTRRPLNARKRLSRGRVGVTFTTN